MIYLLPVPAPPKSPPPEHHLQNEKNKGEPEIEIRIADKQTTKNKQSKKALLETDGENYQTDKSFLDKEESSYYNGEKSEQEEQVNQLRRSSRVKKAPVPLDNNIFRVYQQKKSSLKEKDTNSNTSYESKQTSSESKQIEEKNPFFSSSCSKQEKQQKSKVSNKNQKKQKKQKGQGLYSLNEDENDFYSNQQDELDLSDFFHSKSKPSKKLKSENNQFQGQCQRQLKFDNLDSSIEEQKEISNNSQQNQIKINHRNLDERGDNLIYGDDTFYGNDSFQLMLDSEPTELEEVSDLGYLIENINKYDNEKNKQEGDDDDIEDDVPIDLPDLTSHLIYESGERDNQGQTIFQLENNISCLEQKIFFLKEDSKLKKYSILNDQNFEQYQEKELNRLVSRKEMLESQIKDKRKNKIEKYRQQLHYFDQTIDLKCLPNFLNENLHKSLDRNNNQQIPSYRLIKYKNNQYQDFSKEIPLHFQLSDCNQKFDIIGFSVLTKLNVKPNKHQNQIHNFFSFEK